MGTSVTLRGLQEYLERFGWSRYKAVDEPGEREGIIYTGWRSSEEEEGYILIIDPMVEKDCLSFRVKEVLKAPREGTPPERLAALLMAMGFINYRIILGKFAYDPRDGEVCFSVDVPIDENDFTYEQFEHCLQVTVRMVEQYAPALRAIAAGEKTFEQFMAEETKEVENLLKALKAFRELLETLLTAARRAAEGA